MTLHPTRLPAHVDRRVHLFSAHRDDEGRRSALCGRVAHHSTLTDLPVLDGMPCEPCLAACPPNAFGSSQHSTEIWPPEDDPASSRTYAIGLRGERQWHDIPARLLLSTYEGRTVVLTDCGVIGFLIIGRPPPGWHTCPNCTTNRHTRESE